MFFDSSRESFKKNVQKAEYYGPEVGCKACVCDPDNSLSAVCDGATGQCACNAKKGPFVDPQRCGACAADKVRIDTGYLIKTYFVKRGQGEVLII